LKHLTICHPVAICISFYLFEPTNKKQRLLKYTIIFARDIIGVDQLAARNGMRMDQLDAGKNIQLKKLLIYFLQDTD